MCVVFVVGVVKDVLLLCVVRVVIVVCLVFVVWLCLVCWCYVLCSRGLLLRVAMSSVALVLCVGRCGGRCGCGPCERGSSGGCVCYVCTCVVLSIVGLVTVGVVVGGGVVVLCYNAVALFMLLCMVCLRCG